MENIFLWSVNAISAPSTFFLYDSLSYVGFLDFIVNMFYGKTESYSIQVHYVNFWYIIENSTVANDYFSNISKHNFIAHLTKCTSKLLIKEV